MYQESGPKKPVRASEGGVNREVFLGDNVGVAGNRGRFTRAAKPAVVAADLGGAGRFALSGGVAFAEERADGVFDVGLEGGAGAVEVLLVEQLVLPLASGISGFGVGFAVDEGDQVGGGKAAGDVRDAEIGNGSAVLGVVAGETPDDRAAPVVADPNGAIAAQMSEQVEHVVNAVFQRVIGVAAVVGGAAIATHVRVGATEPEGGKAADLVPPAMRQLGPAMDEDDQRTGFGATGKIEAGVAGGFREVLGHREQQGEGFPSVAAEGGVGRLQH